MIEKIIKNIVHSSHRVVFAKDPGRKLLALSSLFQLNISREYVFIPRASDHSGDYFLVGVSLLGSDRPFFFDASGLCQREHFVAENRSRVIIVNTSWIKDDLWQNDERRKAQAREQKNATLSLLVAYLEQYSNEELLAKISAEIKEGEIAFPVMDEPLSEKNLPLAQVELMDSVIQMGQSEKFLTPIKMEDVLALYPQFQRSNQAVLAPGGAMPASSSENSAEPELGKEGGIRKRKSQSQHPAPPKAPISLSLAVEDKDDKDKEIRTLQQQVQALQEKLKLQEACNQNLTRELQEARSRLDISKERIELAQGQRDLAQQKQAFAEQKLEIALQEAASKNAPVEQPSQSSSSYSTALAMRGFQEPQPDAQRNSFESLFAELPDSLLGPLP